MKKKFCIANWKMNFSCNESISFIQEWNRKKIETQNVLPVICPPFTSLYLMLKLLKSPTEYGAQNIFHEKSGAFTGEISISMLKSLGCKWVILGHSERRTILGESNHSINKKLIQVVDENINPILCIGESIEEREVNNTEEVLREQLKSAMKDINFYNNNTFIIAYEPIWAIGTGLNPSNKEINDVNLFIIDFLNKKGLKNENISIIYGGSVTSKNAENLSSIENLDGFLVGGASLNVNNFYSIFNKLQES